MAPDLTIVIPVWDHHAHLLPRCLDAIRQQHVPVHLVVVDNASTIPIQAPDDALHITLTTRHTIGAARNAGLAHVATPYVVFADADDEITPGALARSLPLLQQHPDASGVVGHSLVHEDGHHLRLGRTPRTTFRLISRYAPRLAPLLWLTKFQCSITSTVLRTAAVRDAGAFPDTNLSEDWQLAARLARRGQLIYLDQPIRIYHRHPHAARNTTTPASTSTLRRIVCNDCIMDPRARAADRLLARMMLAWL